jgi:glutamine synthetase
VPHQEAPTSICWGDQNRSVLVRVPLGWTHEGDLCAAANPLEEPTSRNDRAQRQTFEIRSPDGSAEIYRLLAALSVACRHGLKMPDALAVAERTYVRVNIHKEENKAVETNLEQLPGCCVASADCLRRRREVFEAHGVFTPGMLDALIAELEGYRDTSLRAEIGDDFTRLAALVEAHFHCG